MIRDMESLKSEMLSDRDQDDKLSRCDSIANSIGNISSRLTSLTLQRTVFESKIWTFLKPRAFLK